MTDLDHPKDNHNACIPRLSLFPLDRPNRKDKNRVFFVQNMTETGCHDPFYRRRSVETFKAAASFIKY